MVLTLAAIDIVLSLLVIFMSLYTRFLRRKIEELQRALVISKNWDGEK